MKLKANCMSVKLICFPYAGGSASMYVRWKQKLPGQIEVVPVELSGRGSRSCDPFYKTFDDLINDVYPFVKNQIRDESYALFGFSMGGLIAYEIYRRLKQDNMPLPLNIFIIGREAPNSEIFKVNHLNDHDFIEEIYSYDGMPTELYKNKEVLNYFIPILRADFSIHESYTHADIPEMINCNLTIWYGKDDKSVIHENIHNWRSFAGAEIEIFELKGGHFFMAQHESEIHSKISNQLLSPQFKNFQNKSAFNENNLCKAI